MSVTVEIDGVDVTNVSLNGSWTRRLNRPSQAQVRLPLDSATGAVGDLLKIEALVGTTMEIVFHGRILVQQAAQKTDAKQTNKNLLLSDDATANTKPQLEIYADDVKCTHGAAIGQLDEAAMFYLRSRGLSVRESRAMLVHAFAGDILNRVKIEPVRNYLEGLITARLPHVD